MKLNVLFNNTVKMHEVSSRAVRDQLVQQGKLPSKVAKEIIAIVMKQGCYSRNGLRIVAVGHPKHHSPAHRAA